MTYRMAGAVVLAVALMVMTSLAGAGTTGAIAPTTGAVDTETSGVSATAANATFEVSNLSAPNEATVGEEITITANVTNTGNETGNATVEYRFNGTERSNTTVKLDAGNSTSVSFTFDTSSVSAGTYTHGVFTSDDNETAQITLSEPNVLLRVSNLSAPANATQGDTITVSANITNAGNDSGEGTVEYRFNGTERSNTTVKLDAGNSTTVEFEFDTSGVSAGTYTHGVFTADDNETAQITIETAPEPGPKQGPPPANMAAWKNTQPIPGNQADPSSLGGKIRVERQYRDSTSVRLIKNASGNFTIAINVTEPNATNVTFFLQRQAVESSQNISDVVMYLDGQAHVYYLNESAGPGNSPWILFKIDHFSTRTVSFVESSGTSIKEAIAGSDGTISLAELQNAIQYWASGETVPDTGGKTIDLSTLQNLIQTWA